MSDPRDFDLWVEDDRLRVRFVSAKVLGQLKDGHAVGGDFGDNVIRLPRGDYRRTQRGAFMHELGHYLYSRQELTPSAHQEQVCDLLSWLPYILIDPRNDGLRHFLGLRLD